MITDHDPEDASALENSIVVFNQRFENPANNLFDLYPGYIQEMLNFMKQAEWKNLSAEIRFNGLLTLHHLYVSLRYFKEALRLLPLLEKYGKELPDRNSAVKPAILIKITTFDLRDYFEYIIANELKFLCLINTILRPSFRMRELDHRSPTKYSHLSDWNSFYHELLYRIRRTILPNLCEFPSITLELLKEEGAILIDKGIKSLKLSSLSVMGRALSDYQNLSNVEIKEAIKNIFITYFKQALASDFSFINGLLENHLELFLEYQSLLDFLISADSSNPDYSSLASMGSMLEFNWTHICSVFIKYSMKMDNHLNTIEHQMAQFLVESEVALSQVLQYIIKKKGVLQGTQQQKDFLKRLFQKVVFYVRALSLDTILVCDIMQCMFYLSPSVFADQLEHFIGGLVNRPSLMIALEQQFSAQSTTFVPKQKSILSRLSFLGSSKLDEPVIDKSFLDIALNTFNIISRPEQNHPLGTYNGSPVVPLQWTPPFFSSAYTEGSSIQAEVLSPLCPPTYPNRYYSYTAYHFATDIPPPPTSQLTSSPP